MHFEIRKSRNEGADIREAKRYVPLCCHGNRTFTPLSPFSLTGHVVELSKLRYAKFVVKALFRYRLELQTDFDGNFT